MFSWSQSISFASGTTTSNATAALGAATSNANSGCTTVADLVRNEGTADRFRARINTSGTWSNEDRCSKGLPTWVTFHHWSADWSRGTHWSRSTDWFGDANWGRLALCRLTDGRLSVGKPRTTTATEISTTGKNVRPATTTRDHQSNKGQCTQYPGNNGAYCNSFTF